MSKLSHAPNAPEHARSCDQYLPNQHFSARALRKEVNTERWKGRAEAILQGIGSVGRISSPRERTYSELASEKIIIVVLIAEQINIHRISAASPGHLQAPRKRLLRPERE